MKLLIMLLMFIGVGCGQMGVIYNNDNDNDEVRDLSKKPVIFKGSVNSGFEIIVEGIEFFDTEAFYTSFIDKLVKPKYPELIDWDIDLKGDYNMSSFGSKVPVYMASEKNTFQGKTDSHGVFQIEIPSDSQNQTYRVRIVVRISLSLSKEGQDDQQFCYILHSLVDDVKISDKQESLVFTNYSTQLNKYKCGSGSEGIEIPVEIKKELEKKETEIAEPVEEVLTYNKILMQGMDHELNDVHYDGEKFILETGDYFNKKIITFKDILKPTISSYEISRELKNELNDSNDVTASQLYKNSNTNEESAYVAKVGKSLFQLDSEFAIVEKLDIEVNALLSKDRTLNIANGFARFCTLKDKKQETCVDKKVQNYQTIRFQTEVNKIVFFNNRFYVLYNRYKSLVSYDENFQDQQYIELPEEITTYVPHYSYLMHITTDGEYFYIFKQDRSVTTFEGTPYGIAAYRFTKI